MRAEEDVQRARSGNAFLYDERQFDHELLRYRPPPMPMSNSARMVMDVLKVQNPEGSKLAFAERYLAPKTLRHLAFDSMSMSTAMHGTKGRYLAKIESAADISRRYMTRSMADAVAKGKHIRKSSAVDLTTTQRLSIENMVDKSLGIL
eukprot:scpid18531/ scgid10451/ 